MTPTEATTVILHEIDRRRGATWPEIVEAVKRAGESPDDAEHAAAQLAHGHVISQRVKGGQWVRR